LNQQPRAAEIEENTTLLEVLRDQCGLISPKDGCSPTGQCGCCTVIVDDRAIVACAVPAKNAAGKRVLTLEGFSELERDTFADSFIAGGGLQCGFCTPGMLTTAHALLSEEPDADEARIRSVLSGNLCRCTGYIPIVEAVLEARAAYRKGDKA
jgi:aerobic-type carbon monoxide dehydrogenase small subunit (CoxS/CutS family)